MAMEITVGRITAYDNVNGKGILAMVKFKDYDSHNDEIVVDVTLPLDKDATLAEVEVLALEKAKQQLKELVASF